MELNKNNALRLFHDLYENDKNKTIWISSPFGYRDVIKDNNGNIISKKGLHNGVDYSAQGKSVPCYAIENGIVLKCGKDSSGANYVYVYFQNLGMVGLYYHLDNIAVKNNQNVSKDTKIGMIGMTGNATGIHLHFSWFKYFDYNKSMDERTYYDYNTYELIDVEIAPPVNRNESMPQFVVIVSNLRVRNKPSTNSQILGFAKKNATYNDLGTYKDDKYTWHKIGFNQWVADNGEWLKLLPCVDYEELYKIGVEKFCIIKEKIIQIMDIINKNN